MKSALVLLCAAMITSVASAAEYAIVVAVRPHYVQASCKGCIMPTLEGYDVWWDYVGKPAKEPHASRLQDAPQVGDKFEVKRGQLIPSSKVSANRSRFLGDTSDNF